jgi:hypothetical protein
VVVVAEPGREPERHGEQAGALRRQVEPVGVGTAHDARKREKMRVRVEAEAFQKRVEGAGVPLVLEGSARQIVGDRALVGSDGHDLIRLREEEAGLRIEEAADQPRAGDAIDLRTAARDPTGRAIAEYDTRRAALHEGKAGRDPRFDAAGEQRRRKAFAAQVSGDALAAVVAVRTGDDDRPPAIELRCEGRPVAVIGEAGAGQEPVGLCDEFGPAHVDEDRRLGSEKGGEQGLRIDEIGRAHHDLTRVAYGTWARA